MPGVGRRNAASPVPVAPEMLAHEVPVELHRSHLNAYVIGGVPLHVPLDPCRVEPTLVGPEIEGARTIATAAGAVGAAGAAGAVGAAGAAGWAPPPDGWAPPPDGSGDDGVAGAIGRTRLPLTLPTRPPVA